MKILITGGSGFIGSYLRLYLSPKYDIIAPSSTELNLLNSDSTYRFFKQHYFDAVIHAAGVGRESLYSTKDNDPELFKNILVMVKNILYNSNKFGLFLNMGSGAEFGLSNNIENKKECELLQDGFPLEAYGCAKAIISYFTSKLENCHSLRVFGLADPSEDERRLFSAFKKSVHREIPFRFEDRYFDIVALEDLALIISQYLNFSIEEPDMNIVYTEKKLLSEHLSHFCKLNNLTEEFIQPIGIGRNYTGDGTILSSYNLPLHGLDSTLRAYYA